MSDPVVQRERLAALLRLLRAQEPARAALPSLDASEAFAVQHLGEIQPARFAAMTQFLSDRGEDSSLEPTPAEEVAMRLLLDDYAAAVRRLRVVTEVTGLALERAADTIKQGRRFMRKHARTGIPAPK